MLAAAANADPLLRCQTLHLLYGLVSPVAKAENKLLLLQLEHWAPALLACLRNAETIPEVTRHKLTSYINAIATALHYYCFDAQPAMFPYVFLRSVESASALRTPVGMSVARALILVLANKVASAKFSSKWYCLYFLVKFAAQFVFVMPASRLSKLELTAIIALWNSRQGGPVHNQSVLPPLNTATENIIKVVQHHPTIHHLRYITISRALPSSLRALSS
jgi:hypothetical protein